ncbi:MAG: hypothetical protein ACYC7E_22000 [Armatimonadota bacterium]
MIKNKAFDCVEMKRKAAEKVQARLAGMTDQEKIAYFRQIGDDFRAEQKRHRREKSGGDQSAVA